MHAHFTGGADSSKHKKRATRPALERFAAPTSFTSATTKHAISTSAYDAGAHQRSSSCSPQQKRDYRARSKLRRECQVPKAFTPWGAFYQYICIRRMCGLNPPHLSGAYLHFLRSQSHQQRIQHRRLVLSVAKAFYKSCDISESSLVPGNGERRSHEIAILFGHESQLLRGLFESSHTTSTQWSTTVPHAPLRRTLELRNLDHVPARKRARLPTLYRNTSFYFDCVRRARWHNYNKWAASLGNELATHIRQIVFRVTYIYSDSSAGAQNPLIELVIDLSPGARRCSFNDMRPGAGGSFEQRIQYQVNKELARLEVKTMGGRFGINELLAVGELIRESLPHEAPKLDLRRVEGLTPEEAEARRAQFDKRL